MNQIWIAENTYRGKNSMLKKLVNFFLLEFPLQLKVWTSQ